MYTVKLLTFFLTNVTYSLLRWRSWSPSGREYKDECQMMLSDVILSIGAHSVALVKSEGLVGYKLMYNEGRFKELCFCMHSSGRTRSSMLCFPYLMRTWVGTWTTTSASFVTDPESARVIRTSTSLTSCTVSVVVASIFPARRFISLLDDLNNPTWLIFQQSMGMCTSRAPS